MTDKVYFNDDSSVQFPESDRLGGMDPYAGSKACAELVAETYFHSFLASIGCKVINCRAGNVIGGGDYNKHRLVPDAVRAYVSGNLLKIRSPDSIRPWQHVLEPVRAYLMLAHKYMLLKDSIFETFNIGPSEQDCISVLGVLEILSQRFEGLSWQQLTPLGQHESKVLMLNTDK